uniref:G-protein coupled receptors family 1 profile domain-containing protein n=1 Tax=Panagrolaimus davidi TaxID=227884 RepID=A0A914R0Q3_9BILA
MFLLLIGFCAATVLVYLYFFAYHVITRKNKSEEFSHLLLNDSDWIKEDGKIPPFGYFEVAAFANGLYLSFSVTVISCLIVIICGIGIFHKILTETKQTSKAVKSYQQQITIVMTVEAIVPFITIAFPILLDITAIMFGIYIPWAGKIAFLIGCFSPVINPIVKLGVVSCYRKKILKLLKFKPEIFNCTM